MSLTCHDQAVKRWIFDQHCNGIKILSETLRHISRWKIFFHLQPHVGCPQVFESKNWNESLPYLFPFESNVVTNFKLLSEEQLLYSKSKYHNFQINTILIPNNEFTKYIGQVPIQKGYGKFITFLKLCGRNFPNWLGCSVSLLFIILTFDTTQTKIQWENYKFADSLLHIILSRNNVKDGRYINSKPVDPLVTLQTAHF